jgi:hypothetical protein
MRGLAWLILTAVMLSFAPAARATQLMSCTAGCTSDSSGAFFFGFNYTLPTDGHRYRWDLWSDASHPNAMISLAAPNEGFSTDGVSQGNGTTSSTTNFAFPDFLWNEVVMPGHTEILVWASPDFNFCAGNPPMGTLCSVTNTVEGNNASLNPHVSNAITITFASTVVPEPATWSLMIGGFGALGWALRRRRSAAGQAA